MKKFVNCGTCANHPDSKTRDAIKCIPCLDAWLDSKGKALPNWEDALLCPTKKMEQDNE